MGYRCEFHRPKLYRYRVARVDQYGPLPWFRRPGWNAYRSPHGTARIGAGVVFGKWSYCVKWGSSRAFEVPVRALREETQDVEFCQGCGNPSNQGRHGMSEFGGCV